MEIAVGVGGVGQVPAPAPAAFTVMPAAVAPSVTVTVALDTAPDGFVRRIVTIFPLTLAVTLLLLDAAL